MGIADPLAMLLMKYKIKEEEGGKFTGKVMQLGRQDIYFSWSDLEFLAKRAHFELETVSNVRHIKNPWTQTSCIDDQTFFRALGFDSVTSCDASAYENATHIFDLNQDPPKELLDQYDFIFDSGTLEHIFDTRAALKNIHSMLKVGGKICHVLPTSNFVDHGFYMFSPTFFIDYYGANNYKIDLILIAEVARKRNKKKFEEIWKIYNYRPGAINHLSVGGWGTNALLTIFIATRTQTATFSKIPQQGFYQNNLWNPEKSTPLPEISELHNNTHNRLGSLTPYLMRAKIKCMGIFRTALDIALSKLKYQPTISHPSGVEISTYYNDTSLGEKLNENRC